MLRRLLQMWVPVITIQHDITTFQKVPIGFLFKIMFYNILHNDLERPYLNDSLNRAQSAFPPFCVPNVGWVET